MNRVTRAWTGGGSILLLFVGLAWVLGGFLGLEGRTLWLFRGTLVFLGLLASGIAARLLWTSGPKPKREGPDDESLALSAARERLARSSAPHSRLNRLPLNLVLGPRGSTKTTLLARSGLDPELLAGEVFQGDTVVETDGINLWYQGGSVYLEAGGELLEDETRWKRLLRRLRPSSWGAALGRGGQAPRSVILCYGVDEFLRPGAGQDVPAQARMLRQRLSQLTEELGISVPVYVLFTRADRFPFFLDYVRNLKGDEVVEPLGATLPLRPPPDAGSYPREEGARIRAAFQELHDSLGANRLRVLPREGQDEVRSGAYEFHRELRKITDLATSFLVELTRPSQLGQSPVLRGFYFTGVRPVFVKDAEPTAPVREEGPSSVDMGATGVFSAEQMKAMTGGGAKATPTSARKVPQWVFLDRFFRDLLPGDQNARALTAGGARVHLLRRVGLGLVAAAAFVALVGFTVSFFGNRSLESRVAAASQEVAALDPEPGVPPTLGELQRMEELREELATLRGWAEARPPLRLRWELYQGDRILPDARTVYFQRFEDLLWASTRTRLVTRLEELEGEPGEEDDYGESYDDLKAYLVTTRYPERSESGFLTPTLLRHWAYAGEVDEERSELVRAQFDFFARELAVSHPLPRDADMRRVATTREFLLLFAEQDRVYQALISDGSAGIEPVELARVAPGAGGTVRGDYSIPGAFTEPGWERVQSALADVDRLFESEAWVVGEQAISAEDRERLAQELRDRYVSDYVQHWQRFLQSTTVPGFGSVADAARRLDILSGNQSPILQVLATTARNTAVDSALIMPAFQPVHRATPPEVRDRFISSSNEDYIAGLADLQSTMDQLDGASGPQRDQLMGAASSNAEQTRRSVRQLALDFSVEGPAQVAASEVQRLMEAPVQFTEALITRLPAAQVNARGESFCAAFSPVLGRFPFDRTASAEASMDDLTDLFAPDDGVLWSFYEDLGRSLLARQGSRYVAAPDASPRPTDGFVRFFDGAAEVSRAFFGDQGTRPEVVFALRPDTSEELPELTVSIDGQTHRFTRTMVAAQTFVWDGNRAENARITGQVGGQEVTLLEAPTGPWALFRLFGNARWDSVGDGRYRLSWDVPGQQLDVTAELSLPRGIPVFRGGFMEDLSCTSRIAQ